ncbi:hypothetical protein CE91St46_10760 [Eubacteriales bacterium]|uniref:hypothetical protein n=1 Tax=Anaerotruncus TaxID=244127 RepID=UPI000E53CEFA|nr:hypothetical protein [Anaerotruncus sp. AF02-27]MCM0707211.1 hypothetical protein [Faecalicatena sp. BF-R-105]GKH48127.1 hypothetical protein CE91St45_26890 [Oscillospiraceae bacterium]GKH49965.1 hypothetical protein CE91St46_10760 [Eubacteriales bacterium]RGX55092.1 hypothetical protein DWV16_11010 [Anaerotruncus sp. AF02-27]GKH62601.1 hypothetical protein CE91St47_10700 [Eubacteriales bacterium]
MNYENYHLPANFTDAGKLMGMFQIRNTIESLLISAPILYLCLAFLPFEITTRIIAAMILAVPAGGFALIGINDDCLSRFLGIWWRWRRSRRILTFRGSPSDGRRGQ